MVIKKTPPMKIVAPVPSRHPLGTPTINPASDVRVFNATPSLQKLKALLARPEPQIANPKRRK